MPTKHTMPQQGLINIRNTGSGWKSPRHSTRRLFRVFDEALPATCWHQFAEHQRRGKPDTDGKGDNPHAHGRSWQHRMPEACQTVAGVEHGDTPGHRPVSSPPCRRDKWRDKEVEAADIHGGDSGTPPGCGIFSRRIRWCGHRPTTGYVLSSLRDNTRYRERPSASG